MSIFQSIILGTIQGITEWLPISSSGHLVIVQKAMGVSIPAAYDVALHVGTLLPVLYIFRREILDSCRAISRFDRRDEDFKFSLNIVIATLVTGLIGYAFLDFFESLFKSTLAVGVGLIITGAVVFVSKFFNGKRKVGLIDSLLIGLAQALAIAPGVSRSGLTISTGIIRGVERKTAFVFSFLLSILAVAGAQLFEVSKLTMEDVTPTALLGGIAASALVGYVTVKLLRNTILSGKFHFFAYYCFVAGVFIIFVS